MGENTKIEWTDHTFNPFIGCTKVSPGCDHCYAEALAKRTGLVQWGPHAERRRTSDAYWRQPLAWNRKAAAEGVRKRVFCASMADVFDNAVPDQWRLDLWGLIVATPNLDWLLLSKRPQNIRKMVPVAWLEKECPNVWFGTTACNQEEWDRNTAFLAKVPAVIRFVSVEPMLGAIDTSETFGLYSYAEGHVGLKVGSRWAGSPDWVICGGESGHGARPMHPDWARALRDQCQAAGVPFHFKQWGNWSVFYDRDRDDPDWRRCPPCDKPGERYLNLEGGHGFHGERVVAVRRTSKKAAGALLDGREWREVPAGQREAAGA